MKNKRIDTLKKVYEKYRFSGHMPGDAKKAMLDSKKRTYIRILKTQGKYSVFMLLAVTVFFQAKRLGITLTMFKSTIVAGVVILGTAAVVSTGSYYTYHYFSQPLEQKKETEKDKDQKQEVIKQVPQVKSHRPLRQEELHYALNVVPFEFEGIDSKLANSITEKIVAGLKKLKGREAAVIIDRTKKRITSDKLLVGSIVKVDDTVLLTVKIINARNSKVLFYFHEEAESPERIDRACEKISGKVADKL